MMTEQINVVIANPAGNTTILVLTQVPISRYGEISSQLLAIDYRKEYGEAFRRTDGQGKAIFTEPIYRKEIRGEQVGFVLPDQADSNTGRPIPALNMSGLEFCGNAARAFAFYAATLADPPRKALQVKMSGCEEAVRVEVDPDQKDAAAQMPLPRFAGRFPVNRLGLEEEAPDGILVDMDGISHLVLRGVEPLLETFETIKAHFFSAERDDGSAGGFPAFGVMFLDEEDNRMIPVVYVRDVDTTYFEGSCASGTTAAAFAEVMDREDGIYRMSFREPAGTLYAEVIREEGETSGIRLSGQVELSDVIAVEIQGTPEIEKQR